MSEVVEVADFAYNAPQFCNLTTANIDDDTRVVEEYFNIHHDEEILPKYEDISAEEPFYTPLKLEPVASKIPSNMRKSLSMGNLLLPPEKVIPVVRQMSKDRLNLLAQPKPRMTQYGFVSSAELITNFHQKTPKRFRTTSNSSKGKAPSIDSNEGGKGPVAALFKSMAPTVPQSPALSTKGRARPTMYMPKDIREEQELEDMKKLMIKARPVPKTNYGPAIHVKPEKKAATLVQPFNLTKVAAKKALLPEAIHNDFHAKPFPKSILQKELNDTRLKPLKAIHTKPAPFSFQTRQEEMIKKREQLITKVMEEEKKMREFHAQPIPKSVYKSPMKNSLRGARSKENIGPSNSSSTKFSHTNLSNTTLFGGNTVINPTEVRFKAKPASVLKKEPFVPMLNLLPPTSISAFQLNTQRRVAEREAYELKIREKEEALAEINTTRAQQLELEEKMEAALLRKQMVVKAHPIRHFKPLLPVPPRPVTIPETPKFVQRIKSANKSD